MIGPLQCVLLLGGTPSKMVNRKLKIATQSPRAQDTLYLYTKGGQFSLDGVPYIGEYHLNGDQAYTGPTRTKQAKVLRRRYINPDHYTYDQLSQFDVAALQFVDPIPFLLSPTMVDYQRGFCQRYFVEKRGASNSYPVEIDIQQYQKVGQAGGVDGGLYGHVTIEWKLVGTVSSSEQFNRHQLLMGSKQVPNIVYAVRNFIEFARIEGGVVPIQASASAKVLTDLPDLQDVRKAINLYYVGNVDGK